MTAGRANRLRREARRLDDEADAIEADKPAEMLCEACVNQFTPSGRLREWGRSNVLMVRVGMTDASADEDMHERLAELRAKAGL